MTAVRANSDSSPFSESFVKEINKFFVLNSPNAEAWSNFVAEFLKIAQPINNKLQQLLAVLKDKKFNVTRLVELYANVLEASKDGFDESLLTVWLPTFTEFLPNAEQNVVGNLNKALGNLLQHIFSGMGSADKLNQFITQLLPAVFRLVQGINMDRYLLRLIHHKLKQLQLPNTELLNIYFNENINSLVLYQSNETELWDLLYWLTEALETNKAIAPEIVKLLMMVSSGQSLGHVALKFPSTAMMYFKLLTQLEKHIDNSQLVQLLMLSAPWRSKEQTPTTAIFPVMVAIMRQNWQEQELRQLRRKFLGVILQSDRCLELMTSQNFLKDWGTSYGWEIYNGSFRYLSQLNLDLVLQTCDSNHFSKWIADNLANDVAKQAQLVARLHLTELFFSSSTIAWNSYYMRNLFCLMECLLDKDEHKAQVVAAVSHKTRKAEKYDRLYQFLICMLYESAIDVKRLMSVLVLLMPTADMQKKLVGDLIDTFRSNSVSEKELLESWKVKLPGMKDKDLKSSYGRDQIHLSLHNPDTALRCSRLLLGLHQAGIETETIRRFLAGTSEYSCQEYSYTTLKRLTFCQVFIGEFYKSEPTAAALNVIYELIHAGLIVPSVDELAKFSRCKKPIHQVMLDYVCQLPADEKQPILEGIRGDRPHFGSWFWSKTGILMFARRVLPPQFAEVVDRELKLLGVTTPAVKEEKEVKRPLLGSLNS